MGNANADVEMERSRSPAAPPPSFDQDESPVACLAAAPTYLFLRHWPPARPLTTSSFAVGSILFSKATFEEDNMKTTISEDIDTIFVSLHISSKCRRRPLLLAMLIRSYLLFFNQVCDIISPRVDS
ncbi:hypothetical protein SDJN02_25729, partial [Cucurbita argyrosperma subsp. argyrosperma]